MPFLEENTVAPHFLVSTLSTMTVTWQIIVKKNLNFYFYTHRRQKSHARQQFQMRHYLLLKAQGLISKSGIAVMNLQLFQLISAHSGGVLKFHTLITWLNGKNWIPVRWNFTLVVWNSICNIFKFSRNEIVENRSLRTIQHDLQYTA